MAKRLQQNKIVRSLRIRASVKQVSSLLENVTRTPEWNPLVSKIVRRKKRGRGVGSTLGWTARVVGVPIHGSTVTTAWKPGKEYAWKNTGQIKGLASRRLLSEVDGRFILKPVGEQTNVTAIVTFNLAKVVRPLINAPVVRRVLGAGVEHALRNINRVVTRRK